MLSRLKTALIGSPLPTQMLAEKRLNKIRALAAFSPDALSSIAYAHQEIYLGLLVAGSAGLGLAWPIGLAIIAILIIVATSYNQTIHVYPSGGGLYIVARANLGTIPSLVAAAALLIASIPVKSVQPTRSSSRFEIHPAAQVGRPYLRGTPGYYQCHRPGTIDIQKHYRSVC